MGSSNLSAGDDAPTQSIPRIDCERLEERILYSATPLSPQMFNSGDSIENVELGDGLDGDSLLDDLLSASTMDDAEALPYSELDDHEYTIEVLSDGSEFTSTEESQAVELVFVDQSVEGFEQLIADLGGDSGDHEIILIDRNENGFSQIAKALEGRSNVSAIHVVSHGDAGQVQLGNTALSSETLDDHASSLSQWQAALAEDADVLFYGCNLAGDDDGQDLINAVSELTGADVAASDDLTGQSELGGDWEFEYFVGTVETDVVFSVDVQADWEGILKTFTVTTTDDSGSGSLREAINEANDRNGIDTIKFNLDGGSINTILLDSMLPTITETVIIDGWSESDYGDDGIPVVVLDGTNAGAASGLSFSDADGSVLRGLAIINFELNGIELDSSNTEIYGNYIGIEVDGITAAGNGESGILLTGASNVIGTDGDGNDDALERNLIGGNARGIMLTGGEATSNAIVGNYIGVGADGVTDVGNTNDGINLRSGASDNIFGGSTAALANTISGNGQDGVHIVGGASDDNIVEGNFIGTSADGLTEIGNGGDGVKVSAGGDDTVIRDNLIAGSGSNGIELSGFARDSIIQGNTVGTDLTGTQNWGSGENAIALVDAASNTTVGGLNAGESNTLAFSGQSVASGAGISITGLSTENKIRGNSIYSNNGLGIDLSTDFNDGVDPADLGDVDVGGNTRLNSAVLNSASIEGGLFHYSLDTSLLVAGDYLIDFYASPVLGGDVEGQRYLGTVSNVAGGNANFDDTLSGITLSAGEHVTLLVTDVGGNTSEFSSSVVANEHVNESPVAINNGMTAREGETTTLTSAMLGEADPDDSSTGLTYTITASPSSGFLARASSPLASINTFTQADVDNAEIIYVHDGSESATDSFGFSLADGGEDGAVADTGTFTIDIDPVNDAPTFSNHGGTEAYTEDTSPVVLDSDVSVFDPELSQADDFGGSTITLQRNGAANADDIFSPTGDLTFNGGILELTDSPIGTYANADGILQITFDPLTTNDQVNEVMRSIAYANSNDAPPASVQIDWVFDDGNTGAQGDNGALEATGSTTVSITAVNDAPTVDNAADLVFTVDEDNLDPAGDLISDILASGGGDTIVDFDNANEGIAVTSVDSTNGTWQYSLDDGGSWNDFVAVSETNATLLDAGNRIRFIPNADFNGAAGDIVFRAWDQSVGADGDTGVDVTTTGGSTAFSVLAEKAEIVVNAINDDPVIGFGSGDISYEENDLPTVIDATITASDIDQLDFDGGTLNVALTGNGTANDILSINDQGMGVGQVGVTTGPNEVFYEGVLIGAWSGSGAPLSVTFNGAADAEAVQAVMQNVTYANQSDDPSDSTRTVAFQLTDGDGGTSNSIQKDILFTAVNDAPTITNLIGDTLDYVEGDGLVVIEQGADIVTSDPDSPNYRDGELRVAISSGGLATEDVISIRSVGNGAGEISVAPGGRVRFEGTTIGTFSGGTAGVPFTIQFNSAADNDSIAAAIESIVYENINTSNPLSGSRSVDFTLSDGDGATSPAHTVLINVGTINDAPIVTIDGLGATYTENGIGTQLDSGLTIIDPDGIENFSGGNLTASVTDNGTTADQLLVLHEGNGPGQVEVAGATILIDSVVIGTISGGNGSGDPLVVSFSANADTSHVEQVGQRVAYANTSDAPSELQRTVSLEVTDSGGATSIAATQTVDVVAVNDTPDVTTPTSLTATEQIEVSIAGAGLAVADADSGLNTVTATLSVAEGVLSATQGDSGVSISGSGSSTLTLSGTIDQINDLLARSTSGDVTYLNSSDTPSAGVTLTLEVNDNGNQGIDPGLTGDANSEIGTATTTILVTSVNDAPMTSGASASGAEDSVIAIVLTGTDIDGTVDRFVLSSLPANGTLFLDAALTIPATTATDLVATGESLELYFQPDENWNGTTTFQYAAKDDGSLEDASPATGSISVTAVNDAPVFANNELTLHEGDRVAITVDELSTLDPDTVDGSLTYTVSNVSGGHFELASSPQEVATTFTQADVLAGNVVFVHDGGEVAPAYDIEVSDGTLEDGPQSATIDFTNVNDASVIAGLGGDTLTVSNDGTPRLIDSAAPATLVDADAPADYLGAVLQITGQSFDSLDLLSLDTSGAVSLSAGVTDGSMISVDGNIVGILSGTSNSSMSIMLTTGFATQSEIDTILQSLTFESTSANYGKRSVDIVFNDGDGTDNGGDEISNVAHVTLAVAEAGTGLVTTDEDVTYTFVAADFDFTGVTSSNLRTVTIETLPSNGTLEFDGSPVSAGLEVTRADIENGLLKFVPADNENGPIYANFQLAVNGGNSSVTVLAGEPTAFTLSGGALAGTDAILANSDNFGISGLISTGISVAAATDTIDTDYLSQGDILFSGYVADGEWAPDELRALEDWVSAGGVLISTSDQSSYDDVSAHFGLVIGGAGSSTWNVTGVASAITDGPFGVVAGPIEAAGVIGYFVPESLQPGDEVLATDLAGNPTIVVREFGDGHIVFAADEGIFRANMTGDGSVSTSNEVLAANLFAWAADKIPGDERHTMSVNVNPVNDDPFNSGTLPTSIDATEDVASNVDLRSLNIVDIDSEIGELTVTLATTSGGRLSANTGFAGVTVGNNGTDVITLTGTQLDLNGFFDSTSNLQYTSSLNVFGEDVDSISVSLNDNGNEGIGGGLDQTLGTIAVDVAAVNDEESLDVNLTLNLDEGDVGTISSSSLSSSDVDNTNSELEYIVTSGTSHGTVLLNGIATTTFTQADVDAGLVSYRHDSSETSTDSFEFTVNDGSGTSTVGEFSITINPVNDAPITVDDDFNVDEGATLNVLPSGVSANDTDAENDTLTVSLESGPTNGSLTLNADGSFSYTHDGSETTADSFTYRVSDGNGGEDVGHVNLTINPVNDAPIASGESYITAEDTALNGDSVLDNDSDAEFTPLTAELVSNTENGSVALSPDGSFVYTPKPDFYGDDSFSYRAFDGEAYSSVQEVNITVTPVNDRPVGFTDTFSINNLESLVVEGLGVVINDVDVDGDALTAILLTNPSSGSVTVNSDGSFTYLPSPTFSGEVSFVYLLNDGQSFSTPVTVTIEIVQFGNSSSESGDQGNVAGGSTGLAFDVDDTWNSSSPTTLVESDSLEAIKVESVESTLYDSARTAQSAESQQLLQSVANDLKEVGIDRAPVHEFHVQFQRGEEVTDAPVLAIDVNELFKGLDEAAKDIEIDQIARGLMSGSSMIATTGITATYVLWIVRGSYLVAVLSSSVPTWAMVDPLPILNAGFGDMGSDESLLDFVDKRPAAV